MVVVPRQHQEQPDVGDCDEEQGTVVCEYVEGGKCQAGHATVFLHMSHIIDAFKEFYTEFKDS